LSAEHTLNTTFTEADYFNFVELVDLAKQHLVESGVKRITLLLVHELLKTNLSELGFKAIIFDDQFRNKQRNAPVIYT